MSMKKIFLVLAAVLCVATVSAQGFKDAVKTVTSQKWSVGARVGSGLQVDAECFYGKTTYFEGRFGMGWLGGLAADFTALHNWNVCNWNWTPEVGNWYLDAGAGINIGGGKQFVYGGVAGQVKFGIKFKKAPVRLALDYTPVLGIAGTYPSAKDKKAVKEANRLYEEAYGEKGPFEAKGHAGFYGLGFANIALSATYCF